MKKTCLCCGYKTLDIDMHFDICDICFRQDEPICHRDPYFVGGANGDVSLHQAQQNFIDFGACDKESVDSVRKPTNEDEYDDNWKPFMKNYSI